MPQRSRAADGPEPLGAQQGGVGQAEVGVAGQGQGDEQGGGRGQGQGRIGGGRRRRLFFERSRLKRAESAGGRRKEKRKSRPKKNEGLQLPLGAFRTTRSRIDSLIAPQCRVHRVRSLEAKNRRNKGLGSRSARERMDDERASSAVKGSLLARGCRLRLCRRRLFPKTDLLSSPLTVACPTPPADPCRLARHVESSEAETDLSI